VVERYAELIERTYVETGDERVRKHLAHALQALGRLAVDDPFVRETRAAFDFLVEEYGFGEPSAARHSHGIDVTYRGPGIAVQAELEVPGDFVSVHVVRLEPDGSLPAPAGDDELYSVRLPWWGVLPREERRIKLDELRKVDGRGQLEHAARALRTRPELLRGDMSRWEQDAKGWLDEFPG
jgi:hypothetical protein